MPSSHVTVARSTRRPSPPPPTFSLENFCNFMEHVDPTIREARIVKTCTYVERKRIAPHRRLLLEVCGGERGHEWLRLDRGPTSGSGLCSGIGRTPANDRVRLSMLVSFSAVINDSDSVPTLVRLRPSSTLLSTSSKTRKSSLRHRRRSLI